MMSSQNWNRFSLLAVVFQQTLKQKLWRKLWHRFPSQFCGSYAAVNVLFALLICVFHALHFTACHLMHFKTTACFPSIIFTPTVKTSTSAPATRNLNDAIGSKKISDWTSNRLQTNLKNLIKATSENYWSLTAIMKRREVLNKRGTRETTHL